VRQLINAGFRAAALRGGLDAWREKHDVEPAGVEAGAAA
jgi:rhodanese-related sulfurtransferase